MTNEEKIAGGPSFFHNATTDDVELEDVEVYNIFTHTACTFTVLKEGFAPTADEDVLAARGYDEEIPAGVWITPNDLFTHITATEGKFTTYRNKF